MISSPSPPPAPNPATTAAAATTSNVNTAIANQALNQTNQVTPQGTLNYTSTPSGTNVGGVDLPQYTATTTLNPGEQGIYDTGVQTRQSIADTGLSQAQKIGGILGTPVDLSPGAVSSYLTDLGMKRLQPILDQNWRSTESTLMNRGAMPGSEEYQRAQDAFNRSSNDAYDQLVLSGNGQAVQQLLAARNQPINETTALMSGSQVSQPNFVGTPQTQVAPTDVAGITNNAYQGQLAQYGIQAGQQNALVGGLAGLGGAALGGWGAYNGFNGLLPRRA